jgi:hypothetical protein
MRGTVADRPVVELVLALVDEDSRVDGNPTRTRVAICYEDGDFAEDVLDGATTLREALAAASPAAVRSRMRSRSNSARTAKT